jgi:DNA polymerase
MREWVLARVGNEAKKLMEIYKDDVKKYSIDKSVRANLLVLAQENPEQVPPNVADVIQCADDLWASSVAKFKRLKELADEEDNRVRGAFVFAGGSATGRASSYGAQVHNFTRKCAKEPDAVRQAMVRSHAIVPVYGRRVTDVLKGMLRPAIIPRLGHSLVVADWSAIEARVNPWLSNCVSGVQKLDLFRTGADVYKHNASATFRVAVDQVSDSQRQLGKVQELACGFAGGVGAFAAMGKVYGVSLPEPLAKQMVNAWRMANPWAVDMWQNLENAYTRAMRNVGREFSAGRVTYLYDGQHLWYALPSGRVLCYPFARLEKIYDGAMYQLQVTNTAYVERKSYQWSITYAKSAWKPAADATEWPRGRLWRGLACENITQAVANDLLRHSLRQLDDVILHVHDEIVIETAEPEAVMQKMQEVMCTPPTWAQGLPLNIEVNTMRRYGK